MVQWSELSQKYPDVYLDDVYTDEALLIVQYWLAVHQQNGKNVPADFPLKSLWDSHPDEHLEMERQFLMETRSRKLPG